MAVWDRRDRRADEGSGVPDGVSPGRLVTDARSHPVRRPVPRFGVGLRSWRTADGGGGRDGDVASRGVVERGEPLRSTKVRRSPTIFGTTALKLERWRRGDPA